MGEKGTCLTLLSVCLSHLLRVNVTGTSLTMHYAMDDANDVLVAYKQVRMLLRVLTQEREHQGVKQQRSRAPSVFTLWSTSLSSILHCCVYTD